jgi:hypothetical protein
MVCEWVKHVVEADELHVIGIFVYSGGQKSESSQYAFAFYWYIFIQYIFTQQSTIYVHQIRIPINVGIDYIILAKWTLFCVTSFWF